MGQLLGSNRHQFEFFCLESAVSGESPVRAIEVLVDILPLSGLGVFARTVVSGKINRMKILNLVLLFSFLGLSKAYPCTCLFKSKMKKKDLKAVELIVEGRIAKIEKKAFIWSFTIEVKKLYKSLAKEQETIIITSPNNSCEFYGEIGEEWIIYANSLSDGSFSTDICMRNQLLYPEGEDYFSKEKVRERRLLNKLKTTNISDTPASS